MQRTRLYHKINYALLFILLQVCFISAKAQPSFKMHKIKLPAEVSYFDNQFSSIQIFQNKLYLISESRLQ
ncbi:MAG TPA: hypothetical protein PK841_06795, partial [Chitinophagaceae bacterium]|nr:hypothetical protein [Chitinophagaceae bacterium]